MSLHSVTETPRKPGQYIRTDKHRADAAARARVQIQHWKNEGHPFWKGESAGYASKHEWAARQWGKPKQCEHCSSTEPRMYDWANVSGEYRRERADWLRLCRPCHQRFDRRRSSKKKLIEFRGESYSLKEWSEILSIDYQRLYQRINRLGWPVDRAFTEGRYGQ